MTINKKLSTGKTTTFGATHNCDNISESNPDTALHDCNLQTTTMTPSLQHADRLHFEAATSNGGYVTINNIENNNIDPAIYYSGQTTTHKAKLVIDLVKPFHCSVGSACKDNMLDRGPPVTKSLAVTWRGHFANVFHNTHKFLNERSPNSPPIAAGYEELTGQPPDTVSREAIPNVSGIVKYEVSRAVDHDGGRSLNSPDSWSNVDDFQSEQILLDVPRADGDSVRVWVRATDVMGNTKT
ncbi:hypothetical protein NP493_2407g00005 [Ridgeia piscesae]|uniref:Uncharacterized protein n=1 Tax=Ridgeia piscesae TaxID=27915 RepID=A0AAD9JGK8_RIDPI|nr:hypothetical protein NP493_2407g00005 [Ridgeia piscesae]